MKTKDVRIGIDTAVAANPATQESRTDSSCAEEVMETCAAPHVSFNTEKKQWQTTDGRLFATRKKAENHLNTI